MGYSVDAIGEDFNKSMDIFVGYGTKGLNNIKKPLFNSDGSYASHKVSNNLSSNVSNKGPIFVYGFAGNSTATGGVGI